MASAAPTHGLLSIRGIALLLVATGGDWAKETDRVVDQATWDALFEEGMMVLHRPLHGDAHSSLTPAGWNELECMILEVEESRG